MKLIELEQRELARRAAAEEAAKQVIVEVKRRQAEYLEAQAKPYAIDWVLQMAASQGVELDRDELAAVVHVDGAGDEWDSATGGKPYWLYIDIVLPEHDPIKATHRLNNGEYIRLSGRGWVVGQRDFGTLEDALLYAAQCWRYDQEQAALVARYTAEQAAEREQAERRRAAEAAEHQGLLDAISQDPLALSLLRLFVEHQTGHLCGAEL